MIAKLYWSRNWKTELRGLRSDDTLLLYYSGHAHKWWKHLLNIIRNRLLFTKENGFSSYELTNLIEESNSIRIVEVLDCCYAGAASLLLADRWRRRFKTRNNC